MMRATARIGDLQRERESAPERRVLAERISYVGSPEHKDVPSSL